MAACPMDGSDLSGGLVGMPSPPRHLRAPQHLRPFFLILEIFADLTQEPGSDVCFEVWLLGPGRAPEPSGVTALLSPLFPPEEVPGWQGRCAEFARPFTLTKVLRVTGNGLLKILLLGESRTLLSPSCFLECPSPSRAPFQATQ